MKIAFVTTGADNYFSAEYLVHARALESLKTLENQGRFSLIDIPDEIRTAEHFNTYSTQLAEADLLLIQCGGFTDGTLIPLFAQLNIPMCIWAIEEPTSSGDIKLHSLVTQNLFFSVLKKYCEVKVRTYSLNGNCRMSDCTDAFLDILAVEQLCRKLKNGRICQIGGEAYGFLNLAENEIELKDKFGICVEHLAVSTLVEKAKSYTSDEVSRVLECVLAETVCLIQPADLLENSARIYLALRDIAAEGYLGLAVSCWPELQDEYNMVPCAAFSWLVEYDNIPVSCEGDIGGLLSMIILQQLSGNKPSLLDLTNYNKEMDSILFWHCGFSPSSFAKAEPRLIKHPMLNRRLGEENKLGVSQDFYFHDGDVTVLRVTGRDMKLFAVEARVTNDVNEAFLGTRAWLTDFKMWGRSVHSEDVIRIIMHEGIEHHYALVFGQVAKRIQLFSDINNYEAVN